MGFFSKLWGGVKKVVKKIGSGIKKAVKWVGKQFNKLGIVGQIALMFILPGIGAAIGAAYGAMAGAAAASTTAWVAAAGKVLITAGKFAATIGNAYRTVTSAISGFVTKVGGSMVNKMGSMIGIDKAIVSSAPKTVGEGFNAWMKGVSDNFNGIASPLNKAAEEVTKTAVEAPYEQSFSDFSASGTTPNTSIPTAGTAIEMPSFKPAPAFDANGYINKDMVFAQDLAPKYADAIVKGETVAQKTLFDKAVSYTGEVATAGVKGVVGQFSGAIGQGAAESLGLAPESSTTVTNTQYSTNIPEFNHRPVNSTYETAGFGYGGLPSSRVEYYAGSQQPYGDFGQGSFSTFSRLRSVA
jgi:hypothetical protein